VFENRFSDGLGGYITKRPEDILAETHGDLAQHGSGQHGDFQHGSGLSLAESLILGEIVFSDVQHGVFQHGDMQHSSGEGLEYNNKVVNSIDKEQDFQFRTYGGELKHTFFIGGSPLGTFASVPASRELELRQLILKIKPVQTVGFLFVNYI
jgi:hypothetical protein